MGLVFPLSAQSFGGADHVYANRGELPVQTLCLLRRNRGSLRLQLFVDGLLCPVKVTFYAREEVEVVVDAGWCC
jgi:hypothetical protein